MQLLCVISLMSPFYYLNIYYQLTSETKNWATKAPLNTFSVRLKSNAV